VLFQDLDLFQKILLCLEEVFVFQPHLQVAVNQRGIIAFCQLLAALLVGEM
jgi:hypothetical protein